MKKVLSIVCLTSSVVADEERQSSVVESVRSINDVANSDDRDLQLMYPFGASPLPVRAPPIYSRPLMQPQPLMQPAPPSTPRYQVLPPANASRPPGTPLYRVLPPSASSSSYLSSPASTTTPNVVPTAFPGSFSRPGYGGAANPGSVRTFDRVQNNPVLFQRSGSTSTQPTTNLLGGSETLTNLMDRDKEVKALKAQIDRLNAALIAVVERLGGTSEEGIIGVNSTGNDSADGEINSSRNVINASMSNVGSEVTSTEGESAEIATAVQQLSTAEIKALLASLLSKTAPPSNSAQTTTTTTVAASNTSNNTPSSSSTSTAVVDSFAASIYKLLGMAPASTTTDTIAIRTIEADRNNLEYDGSPDDPFPTLDASSEVIVPPEGQEIVPIVAATTNSMSGSNNGLRRREGILELVPIDEISAFVLDDDF